MRSGGTVSRWTQPVDPFNGMGPWTPDPGPYGQGEKVTCPGCAMEVEVTPVANNMRSSGRQYVARLAAH
jgi:hypothetical protein